MTPPDGNAGALVQRLAALLCLTGAGVFGFLATIVSRLDRLPSSPGYRLPGGATLDPAALTVLAACAGLFALCGIGLLLLAPAQPQVAHRPRRRRPALVLILGIVALFTVLAARRLGF